MKLCTKIGYSEEIWGGYNRINLRSLLRGCSNAP